MTLSLIVPVLNNFKVFAELMATVDYPVQPIIMDNWIKNRGVSGAWNEGMRRSLKYGNNYAIISNDDASFTPGAIKELYDTIRYTRAVIVSPNQNGKDLKDNFTVENGADFFCFIVDINQLVENVGWFDENFFPAYFEDNDMHRRIKLAGLKNYIRKDVCVNHIGSATQFFDKENPVVDDWKWDKVQGYYMSKWGGKPNEETYINPFNRKENSIKYWEKND
jgi:GT2 family glycosyltransferase